MILIFAILIMVNLFNSCSYADIPISISPPEEGAVLLPGEYRVEAVAVKDVDCRGASPEDFMGQVAYGTLKVEPKADAYAVRFDFAGVPMKGHMEPGWLSLRGSLDVPVDQTGSAENSCSGASTSDCDEGETADTVAQRPHSDTGTSDTGTSESGAVAVLDAFILSEVHAGGMFIVSTPDCSYTLEVTLDREVEGAPTEPVEDTGSQPYPGDDTGSQPCGDGADCG